MTVNQKLVINMPYYVLHFLIEKKVFKAYMNNFRYSKRSDGFISKEEAVEKMRRKNISTFDVVALSFCWVNTPEGYIFWREICYEMADNYHLHKQYTFK